MNAVEEWKVIPTATEYEASSLGRIRRVATGRILTPAPNGRTGYLGVNVRNLGERRFTTRPIHRLVADAFLGPRPEGLETRHLNGQRLDNRAANLNYATHAENQRDQVAHGTHYEALRTHCPRGHLYSIENTYIQQPKGSRKCRACHRESERLRRAARRAA